ncbi:MAG: dipeptidase [Pseudomonadota bacterium]
MASPHYFLPGLITTVLLSGCVGQSTQKNPSSDSETQLVVRALAIHDRVLTVDTHADTPLRLLEPGFDLAQRHDPKETGSKVDYPRMKDGGLDAIFFATFVAQGIRDTDNHSRAKALALQMIDAVRASIDANPETVGLALNPADAYVLEKAGKRAIYLGIENGYPVGNDVANVTEYYEKGVRYITLVHSDNNDLADSATDDNGAEHGGISPLGEAVVAEMNRLGIMVDVSHGSDEVFYDAIRASKAPIIASHSNARGLVDHRRNMTDDMLRAMAENGGVVQLTMLSDYLRPAPDNPERRAALDALAAKAKPAIEMTREERSAFSTARREITRRFPNPSATVADAIDHIDHIVAVAGIDHVGIGCDFDGGGGIDGVFDVSEVRNLTIEMVRRGYTEAQIRKIWGGNLMRVFREVQSVADRLQSERAD